MIGRPVFKTIDRNKPKIITQIAEPEACRIEKVRTEIKQDPGTRIAPGRVPHEAGGTIAVEHAATVDLAEYAGPNKVAHPHEMRFKSMVVSRVADRAAPARRAFEFQQFVGAGRLQRLLDQHVLAVIEQIPENLELRGIWRADCRGRVAINRHITNIPPIGLSEVGINSPDGVAPGNPLPLSTLDPIADDDNLHGVRQLVQR